jgi:GT2 family glycosyltransferase
VTARFGCVVLTMGRRPEDLRRALDSLLAQEGVDVDVVVVGNEWEPTGLPRGVRGVGSAENLGIPAGRNRGVPHVGGELLFFLDDDASLASPGALAAVARRFEADARLGLLQLRVEPREPGGARARDWVPRLRVGDPARSSDITVVWEGAVAMRREVFEAVGGWPADFRFVHEGVDLGWRVMDSGHRVAYAGDIVALHPSPTGTPHGYSFYYGARNRAWLARRHLPLPLGALYLGGFLLRSVPRFHSRQDAREALRGYRDGLRGDGGERRPLKARTLWRMTRAGRPPIM